MKPTPHQQAIIDFSRSTGHAVVTARAGSGKTSTIIEFINSLPRASLNLYTPFSKNVAEEGRTRITSSNTRVDTLNAYSFWWCRQNAAKFPRPLKFSFKKNELLLRSLIGEDNWNTWGRYIGYKFSKACDLTRSLMWDGNKESLELLLFDHDLLLPDYIASQCDFTSLITDNWDAITSPFIHDGEALIDYTDQLYLPYKYNFTPPVLSWVIGDEAQDYSPIQWEILRRFARFSRLLIVGDDMQCIFEFRGADPTSLSRARTRLSATHFSLPTCFRCGTAIIDLAQEFVPDITSPEGMHRGEVAYVDPSFFYKNIVPGDVALARTNAELMRAAHHLRFHHSKRVYLRGDGIKTTITSIAKQCKLSRLTSAEKALEELEFFIDQKKSISPTKQLPLALLDPIYTLRNLLKRFTDYGQVSDFMDEIFAEKHTPNSILLSTIHRFKGQESNRVFYINPELNDQSSPSENRVKYVGITRARHNLYLVEE